MRKRRLWADAGLLAGAALLALGTPAAAETDVRRRVLFIDFADVKPLLFESMASEVAALLEPAGLRLDWQRTHPGATSRRRDLRVVLLASEARGKLQGQGVLGSAGLDTSAPTVWVYFPSLMRYIGTGPASLVTAPGLERRRAGVALGRVVAHELVHAMLPQLPHAGRGLMAERTSRAWLLGRHVRLDASSLDALRASLGRSD